MATSKATRAAAKPPSPAAKPDASLVRRARKMYRMLTETYPDAHCELDFEGPFQLLAAVVLSAQCTDVRVNLTTPALFARFPDAVAMAGADRAELEALIRPTGFYRNKATSLLGLSAAVCDRFGGEVPDTLDALVSLPGVGRKTANVVLGNAFGKPGLTVDTHFGRLVRRFGWTAEEDPVKVEFAIAELFPKRDWTMLSHVLIFHGRRVCHAQRPACGACPIARLCPSFGTGVTDPEKAAALLRPASAREAAALLAARRSSPYAPPQGRTEDDGQSADVSSADASSAVVKAAAAKAVDASATPATTAARGR